MKARALPVVLALLGGICIGGAASAATVQVHIYNFDFSIHPKVQPVVDAVIKAGDTVEWVWDEGFHDVTSVAGSMEVFAAPTTFPPATFSHRFVNLGTFHYYCTFHGFDNGNGTAGGMAGTVTVLPLPGDANVDGVVNIFDLLILAGAWSTAAGDPLYNTAADFDNTGTVNIFDLLILAGNWNQPVP